MDKKEARDILVGRLVRLDERYWAAAPSDVKFRFHGIRDGAGDVYLFGVTHLTRSYRLAEVGASLAFEATEEALYSMGRPIRPKSAAEEKACLYAPNWIAPVLLSIRPENDELQMTAYTGKSLLFGRLRCCLALWILEQRLPEGITRLGEHRSPQKNKTEKKPKEPPAEKMPAAKKPAPRAAARVAPKKQKTPPKRLKQKTAPKRLKK